MTREEVKVEFTGMAHDHLMASSRVQSVSANTLHHHHLNNHHANMQAQQQQQQQQQQPLQSNFGRMNSVQQDRSNANANITSTNLQHLKRQTRSTPDDLKGADMLATGLSQPEDHHPASALSTIAILRRHPMYDSLVLVKRYRSCLNGYTLEFPTSNVDCERGACDSSCRQHQNEHYQHHHDNDSDNNNEDAAVKPKQNGNNKSCVSQEDSSVENNNCAKSDHDSTGCGRTKLVSVYLDGDDPIYQCQAMSVAQNRGGIADGASGGNNLITPEGGDIVYVPVNGLLDRLDNYDRQGISIDSRVYAFAMGLKTAERFLTSINEKEIQEAPPL